jgi:pyruvate/2-oxoacid:ferredoxin oxidoreductase alpha subunit
MDLDLRIWMQADWQDVMHCSTDQKVGGSSPSERATTATAGQGLVLSHEART